MSDYILTLVLASLAAAVTELVCPGGEGRGTTAYVRVVAGLFLLAALLSPLKEGLALLQGITVEDLNQRVDALLSDDLPAFEPTDYDAILDATLTSAGADGVEAWVLATLDTTFAVPSTACTVQAICMTDGDCLTLTELRIALRPSHALTDPHPIEAYFEARLGCPCYLTVA